MTLMTHHEVPDKKVKKYVRASAMYAAICSIWVQIYAKWEIAPLEKMPA